MSTSERTASERRAALLWLLVATVIWGSTFVVTRAGMLAADAALADAEGLAAAALGPTLYLFVRFLFAAGAAALLPGAVRGLGAPRAWADATLVGAPFFLGFMLQSYGLVETTATASAFLTSVYVVLVPLIVLCARRERPPARLAGAIALVLAGIALLTGLGSAEAGAASVARFGRGEILSLLCAFAFAWQIYLVDAASRRTPAPALTLGTIILTAAGALLILVAFPGGRRALSPPALALVLSIPTVVLSILWSGILSSVLALYLTYRYQKVVSPSRAAIIYAAEPAFAAAFAASLGSERFGLIEISGCALIVLGNVVAELRRGDA